MSIQETTCCGLREFSNFNDFSDFNELLQDVVVEYLECDDCSYSWEICKSCKVDTKKIAPFLLFTDIKSNKKKISGVNFKKWILKNKLGDVVVTKTKVNPNSNNKLTCYIWEINAKAVGKLFDKIKTKL